MGFHFEDDDGDTAPPAQGSSRVDDESAEGMIQNQPKIHAVLLTTAVKSPEQR